MNLLLRDESYEFLGSTSKDDVKKIWSEIEIKKELSKRAYHAVVLSFSYQTEIGNDF